MNGNDTRNPDEIERDIRATQRDMSDTVNKLEEQLTPRNIMNTLLDKSDENGIDGRYLLDQARRNPIALGMIAIGGLWLVSDSDARPSSLKPSFGGRSGSSNTGYDPDEDYHRGYVEHMRVLEHRPEEDWDSWRRRRDQHRASYLMVEPRHDEDEGGFRKRLDEATEGMRQRRHEAAERTRNFARGAYRGAGNMAHDTYEGAGRLAHDTYEGAERMASQARGVYYENPLIGGLAAALVGAVAGGLIPSTRMEEEQFGRMGADTIDQAKDRARQAGNQAAEQAREKKDELVDRAEQQARDTGSGPDTSSGTGSGMGTGTGSGQQGTRGQEFGTI